MIEVKPGDKVRLSIFPKSEQIVYVRHPTFAVGEKLRIVDWYQIKSYAGKEAIVTDNSGAYISLKVLMDGTYINCMGIPREYLGKPRETVQYIPIDAVFDVEGVGQMRVRLSYEGSEPFDWFPSAISHVI